MGNTSGEGADGFHLLGVNELFVQLAVLRFRPFLRGDIAQVFDHLDQFTVFIEDGIGADIQPGVQSRLVARD